MKICGIYKITSPSGRVYIGQSWDIKDRFRKYQYKNAQRILMNSFEKYSRENHKFEVLKEINPSSSQKLMDTFEIFYIALFRRRGFKLLNIKEGGKGGRHSEETKQRISEAKKGHSYNVGIIFTEEHRRNISLGKKGKKISPESIIKREATRKARPRTQKEKDSVKKLQEASMKVLRKPIIQLKDGIIVNEFISIMEAERVTGIRNTAIGNFLKGRSKLTGGFTWGYKQKDNG